MHCCLPAGNRCHLLLLLLPLPLPPNQGVQQPSQPGSQPALAGFQTPSLTSDLCFSTFPAQARKDGLAGGLKAGKKKYKRWDVPRLEEVGTGCTSSCTASCTALHLSFLAI
jgi:hypothetical protein